VEAAGIRLDRRDDPRGEGRAGVGLCDTRRAPGDDVGQVLRQRVLTADGRVNGMP
jgi:hypothetical protein